MYVEEIKKLVVFVEDKDIIKQIGTEKGFWPKVEAALAKGPGMGFHGFETNRYWAMLCFESLGNGCDSIIVLNLPKDKVDQHWAARFFGAVQREAVQDRSGILLLGEPEILEVPQGESAEGGFCE